jgi:hypothetical protein
MYGQGAAVCDTVWGCLLRGMLYNRLELCGGHCKALHGHDALACGRHSHEGAASTHAWVQQVSTACHTAGALWHVDGAMHAGRGVGWALQSGGRCQVGWDACSCKLHKIGIPMFI